jgi:Ca2+-binding RTX toxin-like protein
MRSGFGAVLGVAALMGGGAANASAAEFIRSDLDFVLQQIRIAEAHANGGDLLGPGPNQVGSPLLPFGLRTVDGSYNNLQPGQELFGAADQLFPRMLNATASFRSGQTFGDFGNAVIQDVDGPGGQNVGDATSYASGRNVFDSEPRVISNLVADQTAGNPAAAQEALDTGAATADDGKGNADPFFFGNVAPDEGLSAPFNSWFTFFGQFFDHGLDLVTKGGSGTVFVPLNDDDPLIAGDDGILGNTDDLPPHMQFMALNRATNQPGPDGILGDNPATPTDESADDIHEHTNTTTPFVDQNQTYTSHPAHQAFLREYELDGAGDPVSTGNLADEPRVGGGLARWADIKTQAQAMLGIELRDLDVLNVPLIVTDQYGRMLPGLNGFAQIVPDTDPGPGVTPGAPIEGDPTANGGVGISTVGAVTTGHAFLDDIAHAAVPFGDTDGNPGTPKGPLTPDGDSIVTPGPQAVGEYDDELLDEHFITGDGRGNENIGLTTVHHVFHAEHNRQVGLIKDLVTAQPDAAFRNEWKIGALADEATNPWNGERLFQAARFATEMQYQHLVFEEFGRKVQPQINIFAGYQSEINPAIVAEFAHTVYRFGHTILTENVNRTAADGTDNSERLLEAFLNPEMFDENETLTAAQGAGQVVRGTTRERANEIDEFVTDALRDNLVGLPLDLAVLNISRGRDTGIPSLNEARRQFFAATSHSALLPYESWTDFGLGLKNPHSLVNFIAAYGTHASITGATTVADRRAAAQALIDANDPFLNDPASSSGVEGIDFWIGGLAERTWPFGGLLGSTFNYVFETQMEHLQDGDRFYYLTRTAGLNFLTELEGNTFAGMIMANTDVTRLPADSFSRPDFIYEMADVPAGNGALPDNPATLEADESRLIRMTGSGTVRFVGGEHIVFGGTPGTDNIRVDDGDDSVFGDAGNDRLEGGAGNDALVGGDGNDIITDLFGDDNVKGGDGHDAINPGSGFDLIIAGDGDDFTIGGEDPSETFGGGGDDVINAGQDHNIIFGNEGDDWIQGGDGADLLQGGNGDPFQTDTVTGHDVIQGDGGNDDYDSEGGDDIMVSGPGIERNEGMLGFDWVTHRGDPQAAFADMRFTGLLPPDLDNIRDRFDLVEALSGWNHDDILRGDDLSNAAAGLVGHELTTAMTDPANPDAIQGIRGVLSMQAGPAIVTNFDAGNIILGGNGADLIEGRGGDDLIDGDAWLNVQLDDGPGGMLPQNDMAAFQAAIFNGSLDPSALQIVRTIVTGGPAANDTAVFSDVQGNYTITQNVLDNSWTVAHTGGTGADGVDTLRNVEFFQFTDGIAAPGDPVTPGTLGTVALAGLAGPGGAPLEDTPIVATPNVTDPAVANPAALVFTFEFQANGIPVGTTDTFTPTDAEVGQTIQVIVTYTDDNGVVKPIASALTLPVVNVNDAPGGLLRVSRNTPRVGRVITAINRVTDDDGLTGATFAFQWQTETAPGVWTPSTGPGATTDTYTVVAADGGRRMRVRMNYTDDRGAAEEVFSDPTANPTRVNLVLIGATVPVAVTTSAVRRAGLPVVLRTQAKTTLVRVRVFNARNPKAAIATVYVRVKAGRVSTAIRNAAVRRALGKGGNFTIELTPGLTRTKLGESTVRSVKVVPR